MTGPTSQSAPLRIGVLVPETNTTMRRDFARLAASASGARPVEFVWEPLNMGDGRQTTDAEHAAVIASARAASKEAAKRLRKRNPDVVVMGFVIETFWGGRRGAVDTILGLQHAAGGRSIVTGGDAALSALQKMGARRVALVTPYQPAADEEVKRFFEESGVEVADIVGLRAKSAAAIVDIDADRITAAIDMVASERVDAVIQVGTNMSILEHLEGLEARFNLPVLAMNALLYEHALRSAQAIAPEVRLTSEPGPANHQPFLPKACLLRGGRRWACPDAT